MMIFHLLVTESVDSNFGELHGDVDTLCDSLTIFRINFVEKLDHLLLDVSSYTGQGTNKVLNKVSSVSLIEDLSEESPGLLEVSIWMLVRISGSISTDSKNCLFLRRILNRAILGVGLIVSSATLISIDGGGAISLIVGNSCSVGAVDGNLVVVGTESVPVGVRV
jgi:hypothetical protein